MMEKSHDIQEVSEANESFYDKTAEVYDKFQKGVFNEKNQQYIDSVLRGLAGMAGSKKLLDIGCGTGNILRHARLYFADIYGVDISSEMLKQSEKYTQNLKKHDINKPFPYPKNTFDVVTYYSVLHHLYDPKVSLSHAYNTLKYGGYIYTDHDPNLYFIKRFNWWKRLRKIFLKKKLNSLAKKDINDDLEKKAEYHNNYGEGLDPESIINLMKEIGFKDIKVIYRFPPDPDTFTKTLIFFDRIFHSRSFKCYFSVIARK